MKRIFSFMLASAIVLVTACAEEKKGTPAKNPLITQWESLEVTDLDKEIYERVLQELKNNANSCAVNLEDLQFNDFGYRFLGDTSILRYIANVRQNWNGLVQTYAKAGIKIEFALSKELEKTCTLSEETLKYHLGAIVALSQLTAFVDHEGLFEEEVLPSPRVQVIRIVLTDIDRLQVKGDPNSGPLESRVHQETLGSGKVQSVFEIKTLSTVGFTASIAGILEALSSKY